MRQLIAALLLSSLSQLALAVPVLWGVDEDDGQLFSVSDYNDAANTFTDYGNLKWNNGGNIEEIGKHLEAFTIRDDGVAFFVANKNIGGFDEPVLFSFDLNTVSTSGNNVATLIGQIDIGFDNDADNITGLSFNPNTGALTVLFQDEGPGTGGGDNSDNDSDHGDDDGDSDNDSEHGDDDGDSDNDSDHGDDDGDSDNDSEHGDDDGDSDNDSDHGDDDGDSDNDSEHGDDDGDSDNDSDHGDDDGDSDNDSDHGDDDDSDNDSDHGDDDGDSDDDSDHGDDDGGDNGTAGVDRLLTIDVTNAAVLSDQLIQGLGEASITGEDITFDADGNIILSDLEDDELYIVDPATGAIIGIYDEDAEGGLGNNPRIEALAYDTENDTLVGFDDTSNLFLNLPQGDGGNDGDFGGIAGLTDVEGLAFWSPDDHSPIPAPASVLLLGLGLLNIGWMRRRQRRAVR